MSEATAPLCHPWQFDIEAVADALGTDLARGLTRAEAARRLERYGRNELLELARRSRWQLVARQFANMMTALLVAAAVVTFALGDLIDTAVIGVIVVLNAFIGFLQEQRAEQATAALERISTDTSRALRDGEFRDEPTAELVPGDVVALVAGDVIPADLRLADVRGLQVNEAALTGESEPVAKDAATLRQVGPGAIAARRNVAFKGTVVTYGRATGIVVVTGMATEFGRIAELVRAHRSGPTPLQRRLAVLGRRLAAAALAVSAVIFSVGVASGEPVRKMLLTAVSLAVAAFPEGLPAVVTIALALGARRMADRHAIVRRLAAVEALGSVTVICSDKTGTLTEHRMMVERVWTPAGSYTVGGSGYAPDGTVDGFGDPRRDPYLGRLARVAAACNDALLHAPAGPGDDWTIVGDPTEAALLALAAKLGVDRADLDRRYPRGAEIAFDAARRRMTTVHRAESGYWVAVKGALGALAPLLDPADHEVLERAKTAATQLGDDGYRVLALAERHTDRLPDPVREVERHLRLVGIVGIADPPRAAAAAAIATCRGAGLRVVMITGDDARTARAIARRVGLLDDNGRVLTGEDLDALEVGALAERVADVQVYARTNPEQKLQIVEAWKARGAIVAMTGDGINDAPALQRADIGVAMGMSGTDVSREAADMVLADDNFATIVHAVEEGRRIYDNIRRVVRYLLTTNSGELWVMLLAPVLGLPLPLLPVQILWINLVTDGLPAIALGLEPAAPDTMRRPPRAPSESVLGAGLWQHALWVGLLMAAVTLPLLSLTRAAAGWPWRTVIFTTLAFLQLGHALAVRSERASSFRLGFRSNPWIVGAVLIGIAAQLAIVYVPAFQEVFGTHALDPAQLATVATVSTAAFLAVEFEKWVRRHRANEALGNAAGIGG